MRKALNASNISCIIKEIRTGLMYARSLQQSHNCDYVIFSSSSGGHSWPFSLTLSFSRLFPIPFSADQPQTVQKLFKLFPSPAGIDPGRFHTGMAQDLRQT